MSDNNPANQPQTAPTQAPTQSAGNGTQPPGLLQAPASTVPNQAKADPISSNPKLPLDLFAISYRSFFILAVLIGTLWIVHKVVSLSLQASLPVLKQEVDAYHIITASDISMKSVDKNSVTADMVSKLDNLIGHYTLAPVEADQPIRQNQIGPQPAKLSLISGTFAVVIPENSTTLLGGKLHAGDVVSMAAVPSSNSAASPVMVFKEVLVLDVKSMGSDKVIILAIPADHWLDYLAKTRNATIVLMTLLLVT